MAAGRAGRHADFSSPRGYYLDYTRAAAGGPVDDHGIPLVRLRSGNLAHSPRVIARAALGSLERYLGSGARAEREQYETLVRWLVDNMEIVPGSFGGWSMPEPPAGLERELPPGWFSASAHAECICALVRSAVLFQDRDSRTAAERALGGLRTSVEDGGFLREVGEAGEEGGLESLAFVDDYPVPGTPIMPLAAHVRGLWAIFDSWHSSDDASVWKLFERCVGGLVFMLDRFDLGYWTAVDLDSRRRSRRPASRERHETHVVMMEVLSRMTPDERIAEAGSRWRRYLDDPRNARRAWLERARTAVVNTGTKAVRE